MIGGGKEGNEQRANGAKSKGNAETNAHPETSDGSIQRKPKQPLPETYSRRNSPVKYAVRQSM